MREYLKRLRKERALSQVAVAERLGMSQSYYNLIESSNRQGEMSLLLAKKLSELFGVSLDFIAEQESMLNVGNKKRN